MKKKLSNGKFVTFSNRRGFTTFGFKGEAETEHQYFPHGTYPRDNGGELYQEACEIAERIGIAKTDPLSPM